MPTGDGIPECHGEPKRFVRDPRYTGGGYWRCRVEINDWERKRYHALDGVAYNRLLLQHRRTKALARRRMREA